ncbi:hypothetical protein [Streptomyces aureoversilis]|uniref:Uncharacterized protein n=1 Tax=Streptomyces aureoversilis TaxID=67277 RepID=A0ABV9ZVT7_9ACTN
MARRSFARPEEIAYYLAHAPASTTVDQPTPVRAATSARIPALSPPSWSTTTA